MGQSWCDKLGNYTVVAESVTRRVAMYDDLEKEFKKVADKDKAKLLSWMQIWCDKPEGSIPAQRLKSQEHFSDDKGRRVHIFALKSYQARLYGFIRHINSKDTFLFVAVDPNKKNDVADPAVLKRAKIEAFKVLDALGTR